MLFSNARAIVFHLNEEFVGKASPMQQNGAAWAGLRCIAQQVGQRLLRFARFLLN